LSMACMRRVLGNTVGKWNHVQTRDVPLQVRARLIGKSSIAAGVLRIRHSREMCQVAECQAFRSFRSFDHHHVAASEAMSSADALEEFTCVSESLQPHDTNEFRSKVEAVDATSVGISAHCQNSSTRQTSVRRQCFRAESLG
jgi:hypothetical protein